MEQNKPQNEQPQTVTVRVNRFQSLVDALESRRTTFRLAFLLFFLGILLFFGITVITLSIKRLYPYSDITTNALGATTIKNENTEVSYWLFNTAILWADSGIKVKAGDVLTIRASGKSNTAVHHLVKAAEFNVQKIDEWVGSEGEQDNKADIKVTSRMKHRIFPNMNAGALLMRVVENSEENVDSIDMPLDPKANSDNFYYIGKERQNIYINNSGTLHFAVNDIVLNKATIAQMMLDNLIERNLIDENKAKYYKNNRNDESIQDTIKNTFDSHKESLINSDGSIGVMQLGKTIIRDKEKEDSICWCELSYYYDHQPDCKTVWYDDNIGSFLIIVEKTR